MLAQYFMSRYANYLIYTFEFLFSVVVLIIVIFLYLKKIERNSLKVYLITAFFHTILELIAEGTGTRVINDASLFGIPIGYPFLPIILGFFEGGLICLGAYHFTRIVVNKDKFSLKFFILLYFIPFTLILFGSIMMRIQLENEPASLSLTRRALLTPMSLILLSIFYSIAVIYLILKKDLKRNDRLAFLYFFIGVVLYTSVMNVPTHIAGVRYIEIMENGDYVYADWFGQIVIMYGFDLLLESGFYIHYFVIIHYFKMIDIDQHLM